MVKEGGKLQEAELAGKDVQAVGIRDRASALFYEGQVVHRAEESNVKAAIDEVTGDLGEVVREPTFRKPRCSDVKSDDLRFVREVRFHERIEVSIADKDVGLGNS